MVKNKEEKYEEDKESLYLTNDGYKTLNEILLGSGYIDIIWGPDITEQKEIKEDENTH